MGPGLLGLFIVFKDSVLRNKSPLLIDVDLGILDFKTLADLSNMGLLESCISRELEARCGLGGSLRGLLVCWVSVLGSSESIPILLLGLLRLPGC